MVTMTVRPLRETFFTERMTMAAARASNPAYSRTLMVPYQSWLACTCHVLVLHDEHQESMQAEQRICMLW